MSSAAAVDWGAVIRLDPGASCLEHAQLTAQVTRWLRGRAPDPAFEVFVRGDAIDARRVGFQIRHSERSFHREFAATPELCADRHAVIGLAIALAIDSELIADHDRPAKAERHRSFDVELGAAYGVLPDVSLGAQIGATWELTSWLGVRADGFSQVWLRNELAESRGTFDALLFAGSLQLLAGGNVSARTRLSFGSGLAAGALHARGRGYAPDRSATAPWFAVRLSLRAELALRWAWLFEISVIAPVIPYVFETNNGAEQRSAPLGLMLHLGPSFRF